MTADWLKEIEARYQKIREDAAANAEKSLIPKTGTSLLLCDPDHYRLPDLDRLISALKLAIEGLEKIAEPHLPIQIILPEYRYAAAVAREILEKINATTTTKKMSSELGGEG